MPKAVQIMAKHIFKPTGMSIPVFGFNQSECENSLNLKGEIWKEFPPSKDYLVSNYGRIKSKPKTIYWDNKHKVCERFYPERILRCVLTPDGYLRITLNRKGFFLHRMVAITFLGESKLDINHKNGIKTDNRISNLEYVTKVENMRHAVATGLVKNGLYANFKDNVNPRKISLEVAEEIRNLFYSKKHKQKELAEIYEVCKDTIGRICRYKSPYCDLPMNPMYIARLKKKGRI